MQETQIAAALGDCNHLGLSVLDLVWYRRPIVKVPGGCAGVGGERGDDWHEVKISVADVKQDDAAGRELSLIQRKRFSGQKVNRYAIGAESVDDDRVVELVGHSLQGEPGVAEHETWRLAAFGQEMKIAFVSGESRDRRIDLMKRPNLPWPSVTTKFAATEPDYPNPP
jgi:hypothetical protein